VKIKKFEYNKKTSILLLVFLFIKAIYAKLFHKFYIKIK